MVNKKEIISELQNRLSSLLEESDAIAKLLRIYAERPEGKNIKHSFNPNPGGGNRIKKKRGRKQEEYDKNSILKTIFNLQLKSELDSWFTVDDLYKALARNSTKPSGERVFVRLNLGYTPESMAKDKVKLSAVLIMRRNKQGDIGTIRLAGYMKECLFTLSKKKIRFNEETHEYEVDLESLPEKYKYALSKSGNNVEVK